MKRGTVVLALAAAMLLSAWFLSACTPSNAAETRDSRATLDDKIVRDVRTAEAYSGEVDERITRMATLLAPRTVDLLPRVAGQVVELKVEEGRKVDPGDIIVRIEDDQLRLAERKFESIRDKAHHDLELARTKLAHNIIGREELLQAEHTYEQAEKDYQSAVIERNKTKVVSPISGVISKRHVSLGDTVFTTTPIVTITDMSVLEAEVLIPFKQVGKISVGNPARLLAAGEGGVTFGGVVDRISPVVDPGNGTVKVTVRLNDRSRSQAMPGLYVKVDIITGTCAGVTMVPRDAIVVENALSVVYKVTEGVVRRIPVIVGFTAGSSVQVSGEVYPGDSVVVSGNRSLSDMVSVRVLGVSTMGNGN